MALNKQLVGVLAVAWAIGVLTAGERVAVAQANGGRAAAGGIAALSAVQGTQTGFVGDDTCFFCHSAEGDAIKATPHGKAAIPRSPAATGRTCETCHGPGQAHVDSGDKAKIRRLNAVSPRDASETCLSCHNRGDHANWQGSPHDSRNLSCVTCHSVHHPKSPTAQLVKASELEMCATCHKTQAMKVRRTQHMPITEGKMTCTTCHNPHGSVNVKQLRVGTYINEACVSCHAEKRGPFLWEHAAGRESCVTCHDPHGSSNDRLLVAKAPMLCQRCHIGTGHPSQIFDATRVLTPATASSRIYGRACVNCHSNIHGSNHPSGSTFLR